MKHLLLLILFSIPTFANDYSDKKVLVQNHYYPKPGKLLEVLNLRIEASKLLKEFGLSAGSVSVSPQTNMVIWHCEYENAQALDKELKILTDVKQKRFQKEILDKMKPLIEKHQRLSSYVVF